MLWQHKNTCSDPSASPSSLGKLINRIRECSTLQHQDQCFHSDIVKGGDDAAFYVAHSSCRDTSIIKKKGSFSLRSKERHKLISELLYLEGKKKICYENPEIIKCSYGMFLPFSGQSPGKFMLFTSTLSGHELLFQSPKCMPFL